MKKIAATHVVSSNSLTNSGAPATVMGYITSYLIREITRKAKDEGLTLDWGTFGAGARYDGLAKGYIVSVRADAS